MKKKIILSLLLLLTALILWQGNLILYGIGQLKGQLHIVNNATEVSKVIEDPATPDSIRKKLLYIDEVRRYAMDSLSLKNSDNYTTYYDQKDKPAIWVITACEPFRMKAYEWNFPFLGSLSYKGFFIKEKGYPEFQRLRQAGYDVDYNPAGGWSTLGWFRDPILSRMLRRNEGQLAELIIHELTHATIYIRSDVDFNENLATFVGEKGAAKFLRQRFGVSSIQYQQYMNELHDEQLFGEFMVKSCKELDRFYSKMPKGISIKEKQLLKYRKIAEIVLRINQLGLKNPERFSYSLPKDKLPDNTFFMSYQRYRGSLSDLDSIYRSASEDIPSLLKEVRSRP
jgi:predicted aminopeptidase